jgi:hypothetical protein
MVAVKPKTCCFVNNEGDVVMGMQYIRKSYQVPAKRGGRVLYLWLGVKKGTIKSAQGGRLRILLDGEKHVRSFHPTWKLQYL